MEKPVAGVAAANLAAADVLPFFPHSYELTPHWSWMSGTCIVEVVERGLRELEKTLEERIEAIRIEPRDHRRQNTGGN